MIYLRPEFFLLLAASATLRHAAPKRLSWVALLFSSAFFYFCFHRAGWWIALGTATAAYVFSRLLSLGVSARKKNVLLALSVLSVVLPWLLTKVFLAEVNAFLAGRHVARTLVVPLGVSFYTMQLVAYLADVRSGKIAAQRNFLKFLLFATYFPQMVQGPIPRYAQLAPQLFGKPALDRKSVV